MKVGVLDRGEGRGEVSEKRNTIYVLLKGVGIKHLPHLPLCSLVLLCGLALKQVRMSLDLTHWPTLLPHSLDG